ncbi:MAG: FAD-dependent oxidoreductase [Coprobacillaceae bacterium]
MPRKERIIIEDIIIIGGGFSGSIAAIAAARTGANVLVVEKNGYLGGALTGAGVGPMMTFHVKDKQIIQGITAELIERLKAKGKSVGHILDASNYTYSVTPFDSEAMKYELELMFLEYGGKILYHTILIDVERKDKVITSITVCNKAGIQVLKANIFVDATGDADLAYKAKVPCDKGRKKDHKTQPMTMNMKIVGVDREKLIQYIINNPSNFKRIHKDISILTKVPRLSVIGFEKEFAKAKLQGKIHIQREDVLLFETNELNEFIVNTTRILDCDPNDPYSISLAEIEGRKQCQELERFMKEELIGFENIRIIQTGPNIGVRESRQIEGYYQLHERDIISCIHFQDVIAHTAYPIDVHSPDGEGTYHGQLKAGEYYEIPYRIVITPHIDNLLVTGRCVSATFEAQAAIRTTPTVGAIGHAVGVAAALSIKNKQYPYQLDVLELQEELIKQKAYLEIKEK